MLRRTAWRVVCVAVAGCLAVPAVAADGDKKGPNPEKVFQKKDANGDGSLSLEEFKAGMPEKALAKADTRFKRLDANGDGKLSLDEFKAGMKPKE
jgi:Ca2+-binding EF-hand superfamily protein